MQESVENIKGIGEKSKEKLSSAGILTVKDLLFFLPKRYNIYTLKDIDEIIDGESCCIKGVVNSALSFVKFRGSTKSVIFYFKSKDKNIRIFGFGMEYLKYSLKKGMNVILYGKYNKYKNELILKNIFFNDFYESVEAIYGIKDIKNKQMTNFIFNIYCVYNPTFEDEMPLYLKEKYKLLDYNEYLYKSHFAKNNLEIKEIERRKKYQEFLKFSLGMYHLSYTLKMQKCASMSFDIAKINEFIDTLPFDLTEYQNKAILEILDDLKKDIVMNRILCGDTGSGKTIVAFIAAYATILSGYQAVLMVPSEVLSRQHYQNALDLLSSKANIVLLNSTLKVKQRNAVLEKIENGEAGFIIGTQSLIGDIKYHNLGLCIIDEQHRFGVVQRSKLVNKGKMVNSLFLTATPIPRSLMITDYGGLSLSVLKEKPSGRKKVLTKIWDINDTAYVINAINKNIKNSHQVFVVVPKISDDMDNNLYSINMVLNLLDGQIEGKVETLHSKMADSKKISVMNDFRDHKFDCLISTTVIEVGVDIKDATLMVVFNAEMFGLSTIHQLRGRVGRNDIQSGCLLLTDNINNERLKILESNYDSFAISEADLKLRGPGEILGFNQSGDYNFDPKDNKILECALKDAAILYENHINGKDKYKIIDNVIAQIKDKNINLN